eukprot:1402812-Pleurochrysis_carterae.AAC.4
MYPTPQGVGYMHKHVLLYRFSRAPSPRVECFRSVKDDCASCAAPSSLLRSDEPNRCTSAFAPGSPCFYLSPKREYEHPSHTITLAGLFPTGSDSRLSHFPLFAFLRCLQAPFLASDRVQPLNPRPCI